MTDTLYEMFALAIVADELERKEALPLLDLWVLPSDERPDWTREEWITKFRALGFRADGYPSTPKDQTNLYRGCRFQDRQGLSWTSSLLLAEWFARKSGGEVFVCDVPADRLLARIGPDYTDRQASAAVEFVADVAGLALRQF